MPNPLYEMLNGQMQQSSAMNPMNKFQLIMQAMRNPASFVKQKFPDIPEQIQDNPNAILQYLQQTRGISNQQIQQLYNTYGGK